VSHVCHFRPQESVQIVIVARVKLQEEETVARGAQQRRQVSEGLFSLMREGIIKSLMGLFKKHQERKRRERETDKENTGVGKKKKDEKCRRKICLFSLLLLFSQFNLIQN